MRVLLRDRPGALGAVASRIGAIGCDINAVDVLESDGTAAIDEFSITVPNLDLLPLLRREIEEVDGVVVEHCRVVTEFRETHLDALRIVDALSESTTRHDLHERLAEAIRRQFSAAWVGVITAGDLRAVAGDAPAAAIVHDLARRPSHATSTHDAHDLAVVVARDEAAIHERERAQLDAIVVIAHRLASRLS